VTPVSRWNITERWLWLAQPTRCVISVIGKSVSRSSAFARSILRSNAGATAACLQQVDRARQVHTHDVFAYGHQRIHAAEMMQFDDDSGPVSAPARQQR